MQKKLTDSYLRLQAVSTIREGISVLSEIGESIGFPMVGVASDLSTTTVLRDEDGKRISARVGWPDEFIDKWLKDHYTLLDPIALRCQVEHLPFVCELKSMLDLDIFISRQQRRILQNWIDIGIVEVIAIPLHLPRARVAAVILARQESEGEPFHIERWRGQLLAIGHLFMDIVLKKESARQLPDHPVHLTPREIECLAWSACGKSDQETGIICSLSPSTVRSYIDSAALKLGATTRTQAVAMASALGLITRSLHA